MTRSYDDDDMVIPGQMACRMVSTWEVSLATTWRPPNGLDITVDNVQSINGSWEVTVQRAGLLIAVALHYRYCSGATFTVVVVPLLLVESSGDGSTATF